MCRDQLGAQGFADESIGYMVSGCNFQVAIPSTALNPEEKSEGHLQI